MHCILSIDVALEGHDTLSTLQVKLECSDSSVYGIEGACTLFCMKNNALEKQKSLLGKRIRALRTTKGLTQQQLGESADVHYKFIGECERGERWPSTAILFKLADALGIPPREMLVFEHGLTGKKALEKAIRERLGSADEDQLQMFLKFLDTVLY